MTNQRVLTLKGLSKTFGTVIANRDVNLHLDRGEVLALLGENGAGKTTLMNMLFGHYLPDEGSIEITDGKGRLMPLPLGSPQAALNAGIGMVHQHFTLADNLNALDNIMLGSEGLTLLKRDTASAKAKLHSLMEQSGLSVDLDVLVGSLTVGERQRVEILKALYRDVNILVLDEPTAVLTPQEADTLFANIRTMTKNNLSVIFISHKLREVLLFSDRIAVLRHGEHVGELVTSKADENTIARLMVGAETQDVTRETTVKSGKPLLCFENVSVAGRTRRNSLHAIDLTVNESEILGIAGTSGNGQTALAGLISGTMKPESGRVTLEGSPIHHYHPSTMIDLGIGRIPEDRHRDGIVGGMSVAENIVIERLGDRDVQAYGLLKHDNIRSHAETLCQNYDVRGPGTAASSRLLSGGNIQKLILARVFESMPRLILANQPTRGLDMGAAAEVARRLLEARSRGVGIILISEDLDEIISLSDRIMVIHDGKIHDTHTHERETLGLLMAGKAA